LHIDTGKNVGNVESETNSNGWETDCESRFNMLVVRGPVDDRKVPERLAVPAQFEPNTLSLIVGRTPEQSDNFNRPSTFERESRQFQY